MTEIAPRITVDEKVRFGKPVIAGTRVPVDLVVEVSRSLGERRKVPGVEGLAEHGGDREKVAQLFR